MLKARLDGTGVDALETLYFRSLVRVVQRA